MTVVIVIARAALTSQYSTDSYGGNYVVDCHNQRKNDHSNLRHDSVCTYIYLTLLTEILVESSVS